MDTVIIKFSNEEHSYPKGTPFYKISEDCKDVPNIVAVKIGNEVFSLTEMALESCQVEFINYNDNIGNKIYKAGLKFIFEVALQKVFPSLDIHYEHSVPKGMLGLIKGDKILTSDDIGKIKEQMVHLIDENIKIEKLNVITCDAIKYYREEKLTEKAQNIQNINDKIVSLYRLDGHLNYFYTLMPYSTAVINKFDMVYLGNNKIIFIIPNKYSNNQIPEYVHYENIISSFYDGKEWLEQMHMPYIANLNKTVGNGKIKDFIRSSEIRFNLTLANIAKEINESPNIKFIMIAGPSSSGKTTTSLRLASYLETYGYNVIRFSIDDYFVNRDDTPKDENGKYDFECLEAIDKKQLNDDLKALLNGKEISLPKFNFITGKREATKDKIKLQENTIILMEGLHALNDELVPDIENKYKYKIYLSPFIPINIDRHNYISTLDLRLIRRIIRDNRTRGYTVTKTMENWEKVREGEEKYIFPYVHQADVIINTALAYEVGVLKVYVEPLLYSVGIDNTYYEEARRLLDFLKQFYPIPGEYINDESIIREFIGGKYND